jgi:hypothetical protein
MAGAGVSGLRTRGLAAAARGYDDVALARQAIDPLLDAAQVRAGLRVLDVASGLATSRPSRRARSAGHGAGFSAAVEMALAEWESNFAR